MEKSEKFIVEEVNSELFFYDPDSDGVHILNTTAGQVYRLLLKGKTEGEITAIVKETCSPGEESDVEKDVSQCIRDLVEKGLVLPSNA